MYVPSTQIQSKIIKLGNIPIQSTIIKISKNSLVHYTSKANQLKSKLIQTTIIKLNKNSLVHYTYVTRTQVRSVGHICECQT